MKNTIKDNNDISSQKWFTYTLFLNIVTNDCIPCVAPWRQITYSILVEVYRQCLQPLVNACLPAVYCRFQTTAMQTICFAVTTNHDHLVCFRAVGRVVRKFPLKLLLQWNSSTCCLRSNINYWKTPVFVQICHHGNFLTFHSVDSVFNWLVLWFADYESSERLPCKLTCLML